MYHVTTFCFQTYQKDIENVEREWETVLTHITGYFHHTNTTSSCNSTSKLIRTTSTTISINNFSPTMFLKLSLSKKSTKPAHITTPKLHRPTLNKFSLNDTRLKRHKQPLPFKHPSPVSNHTPAPVRKCPLQLSLPQSQNPHPTQRFHLVTLPNSPPPHSQETCSKTNHSHRSHRHHSNHTNRNTHPHAAEHIAPAQIWHTINRPNHTHFILHLTLKLSLHAATAPAFGTLGDSPLCLQQQPKEVTITWRFERLS